MQFSTNFDVIDRIAGAVAGMEDGFKDSNYLDSLCNKAHDITSSEFDAAAAASASAGFLNHVYEFGVAGITRGPVRIPDPLSPEARLWTHNLSGTSGKYNINYSFRPAVIPNPTPTVAYTGVSNKVLKKLSRRKYVFYRKAFIMESGESVEIHAKSNNWLFIPFGNNGDKKQKNYVMWNYAKLGPITTTPGRKTKGTFTAFWDSWWGSAGNKSMTEIIDREIYTDVNEVLIKAQYDAAREKTQPISLTSNDKNIQRKSSYAVMVKNSKRRQRKRSR